MKNNKFISLTICGIMAATSFSALAEEKEPMLIAPATAENETLVGVPQISVNGEVIDFSKSNLSQYLFEIDANTMVPLRAVAEKMGFTVGWDAENRAVTVESDTWEVKAYIGEDLYSGVTKIEGAVGMTAPQSYGTAPVILENSTFVPAKMFELMGYSYSAIGQFVNFTNAADDENTVQIPNPFVPYESIDAAKRALSFTPSVPTYLPNGYSIDEITVVDDDFLQIVYKDDKDESIFYRTAKGSEDISGDYNNYKNEKKITIGNCEVTLRGNENIAGAIWNGDDMTYSISSDKELPEKEIKDIIISLK